MRDWAALGSVIAAAAISYDRRRAEPLCVLR
jgi:hypothetical protein